MPSTPITFFGNEQLSTTRTPTTAPAFSGLINAGYDIEALIIKQRPQKSRSKKPTSAVEALAEKHRIPIIRVQTKHDLAEAVYQLESTTAVLAAFGMIINKDVLTKFSGGIVNIHPSMLPKYRGSTPIESAILNGDGQTGVSLMRLEEKMDSGPIYAQEALHLTGVESKADLTAKLSQIGARLLTTILPSIIDGSLKPYSQDESKTSYTPMLSKDLSVIDWGQSAASIERQIRAYIDWPGSKTSINNVSVIITKAHPAPGGADNTEPGTPRVDLDTKTIAIDCMDSVLCIDSLKPSGKGEMSAADFINGHYRR